MLQVTYGDNGFVVRQWIDTQQVPLIRWPALSPDLNPLENLWSELKCLEGVNINNLHDLWPAIEEQWEAILADFGVVILNIKS